MRYCMRRKIEGERNERKREIDQRFIFLSEAWPRLEPGPCPYRQIGRERERERNRYR